MMNEKQEAAVRAEGRIQVLVAGAGSGKTRVLTNKVQADQARGIHPSLQVVITFTNAAANEFRKRLSGIVKPPAFVGTLHAFALKHISPLIGDVRMIGDREFDELIHGALDAASIKGVSLRKVREFVAGDGFGLIGKNRAARAAVVTETGKRKVIHPDMILGIFKRNLHRLDLPDHLHVYVDEFQDTAGIDAAIYKALVEDLVATLFVVGDPRQAIFSFRGATSSEFLSLWGRADWRGQLTTNYRSRPELVKFSNMIAGQMTLPANIDSESDAARDNSVLNEPPTFREFTTCEQEAEAIADHCKTIAERDPAALEDFAVLCRYNASVGLIRDVLKGHGFEVACSLDHANAVVFLESDETVKRILNLGEFPPGFFDHDPEMTPQGNANRLAGNWGKLLIKLDAPKVTRDLLQPILEEIDNPAAIPFALKEGLLRRKAHAVTISTVHAAKGLEWPEVWISGADVKSFDPNDPEDVRLAYVAATRAEDRLVISSAESRISFRREVNLTPSPIFVV
jgi:DNA helicase-2/ATP-dependent DNA helicase PcrA